MTLRGARPIKELAISQHRVDSARGLLKSDEGRARGGNSLATT